MKYAFSLMVALLVALAPVQSQSAPDLEGDPVLFTVNGKPVHVSEFLYIYSKSNAGKADFSEESLREYLDLYIKFKLKVEAAREMGLDTLASLREELAGYRRQLADSYLIDKEVMDKLVRELYERKKQDVDISHILVSVPRDAAPEDTLRAWQRIMQAKAELEAGADFAEVAKKYSNDRSVERNHGHIGYVTVPFPNGYYNLETAAYTSPIGKVVGPIRTDAGYHLLVVHGRRPARGEMEVAHILIRKDSSLAEKKAWSIYQELQRGASFEELAGKYSEDQRTAPNGGYIGFFGINRFEQSFEDAAFALEHDGDISEPTETSIGYHIIKRISHRGLGPLEVERNKLKEQIKRDRRFEMAREAMIERIKRERRFQERPATLQAVIDSLSRDSLFLTWKWKAPQPPSKEVLFTFGDDYVVTVGDFMDYMQRSTRKRLVIGRTDVPTVVRDLYRDFVNEHALRYEERHLEERYPDFKALMREYEEGILLFEATKRAVWDKAAQDTVGLKAFFETVRDKYQWDTRAVATFYTVKAQGRTRLEDIRAFAKNHTPEEVVAKFNTDSLEIVTYTTQTIEKGRNKKLDKMDWTPGAMTITELNRRDGSYSFIKIEDILPPQPKTLEEARGYVVADYQDKLEAEWVEQLRKKYEVKVNEEVFRKLIRR